MALRPSTNPVVPIGFDFFVAGRLCDTKKIKSHAGVLLLGCEFRFLHGWHVGVSLSDLYIGVLAVAPLAFYMRPCMRRPDRRLMPSEYQGGIAVFRISAKGPGVRSRVGLHAWMRFPPPNPFRATMPQIAKI